MSRPATAKPKGIFNPDKTPIGGYDKYDLVTYFGDAYISLVDRNVSTNLDDPNSWLLVVNGGEGYRSSLTNKERLDEQQKDIESMAKFIDEPINKVYIQDYTVGQIRDLARKI